MGAAMCSDWLKYMSWVRNECIPSSFSIPGMILQPKHDMPWAAVLSSIQVVELRAPCGPFLSEAKFEGHLLW